MRPPQLLSYRFHSEFNVFFPRSFGSNTCRPSTPISNKCKCPTDNGYGKNELRKTRTCLNRMPETKTGHDLNQINRMRFDFLDTFSEQLESASLPLRKWLIHHFVSLDYPVYRSKCSVCRAVGEAVFGADIAEASSADNEWKETNRKHRNESNIFHFPIERCDRTAMNQMRCQTNDIHLLFELRNDARVVYCFAGFFSGQQNLQCKR